MKPLVAIVGLSVPEGGMGTGMKACERQVRL